jgi:hypothetical protein
MDTTGQTNCFAQWLAINGTSLAAIIISLVAAIFAGKTWKSADRSLAQAQCPNLEIKLNASSHLPAPESLFDQGFKIINRGWRAARIISFKIDGIEIPDAIGKCIEGSVMGHEGILGLRISLQSNPRLNPNQLWAKNKFAISCRVEDPWKYKYECSCDCVFCGASGPLKAWRIEPPPTRFIPADGQFKSANC